MEALILTCGTGGGHDSAARALAEELRLRGHEATVLNPYNLISDALAEKVGMAYIGLVRRAPRLFGFIYNLGAVYRKMHVHSPVYAANKKMIEVTQSYLDAHPCDAIFTTHIFSGMILAASRASGYQLPTTYCIATDYTCIPFTEETDCDYYVAPSEKVVEEFTREKIPREKVLPFGIPVGRSFREPVDRAAAIHRLGLEEERHYILLMGGSIGAGKIKKTVADLERYFQPYPDRTLIVICGSNQRLFRWMTGRYGKDAQIILLEATSSVADYMSASDVVISKPGGLSSTEAGVLGVPLIHIDPIPGCETKNRNFFARSGMSLAVSSRKQLLGALEKLKDPEVRENMLKAQRRELHRDAAQRLCAFAERQRERDA